MCTMYSYRASLEWQLPRPVSHLGLTDQEAVPRPIRGLVCYVPSPGTTSSELMCEAGGTSKSVATTASHCTKTTTFSGYSLRMSTRTSRPLGGWSRSYASQLLRASVTIQADHTPGLLRGCILLALPSSKANLSRQGSLPLNSYV